ncbi:MAG: glycosyltransferase family 4 protein, partial [Planctomycetota bacterium]
CCEYLNLPDYVEYEFAPSQSRIADTYASADVWLVPSTLEGYGLPTLEAMACRTPVICTPAGAAPTLAREHGGGTLVPVSDPVAMAQAILDIEALSPEAWRIMSDAAYRTARSRRWEQTTDQFEQILQSVATATTAPQTRDDDQSPSLSDAAAVVNSASH